MTDTRQRGPAGLVAEAVGYLGGALALTGGLVTVTDLWPDMPVNWGLALAAATAAAMGTAGAFVPREATGPMHRLKSALWVVSALSAWVFTLMIEHDVAGLAGTVSAMLASGMAAVYGLLLWHATKSAATQLLLYAAAATTAGAAAITAAPSADEWGIGLAVWAVSAGWAVAAEAGVMVPRAAGRIAAGAGLFVALQFTMLGHAGYLLGVVTVAGLLMSGIALWLARRRPARLPPAPAATATPASPATTPASAAEDAC